MADKKLLTQKSFIKNLKVLQTDFTMFQQKRDTIDFIPRKWCNLCKHLAYNWHYTFYYNIAILGIDLSFFGGVCRWIIEGGFKDNWLSHHQFYPHQTTVCYTSSSFQIAQTIYNMSSAFCRRIFLARKTIWWTWAAWKNYFMISFLTFPSAHNILWKCQNY